jgi:hypothetical protein
VYDDIFCGGIKKASYQLLRKPNRAVLHTHFNAVAPGLVGERQKLRRMIANNKFVFFVIHYP